MQLTYWSQLANSSFLSLDDGCIKVHKTFHKFVDFANEHDLKDTPCVKMLENAIAVCESQSSFHTYRSRQNHPEDPRHHIFIRRYSSKFCRSQNPYLQHILGAMYWIYSCCVGNDNIIKNQDAEFYLYQVRLIFQVLKATK